MPSSSSIGLPRSDEMVAALPSTDGGSHSDDQLGFDEFALEVEPEAVPTLPASPGGRVCRAART